MNKQILTILRLSSLIILSLCLFSKSLRAQELVFLETPFDPSLDYEQLLPGDQKGTASWTADTKTLLLRDVQASVLSKILTGWMPEEITIRVEGTNSIVSTGYEDAIQMRSSVRITGPGSLSITSNGGYAYACRNGGSLTISDGVSVTAIGNYGGIVGDFMTSTLLIDKAYVTASTLNNAGVASIGYFSEIDLRGCAISSPAGAKIAELNETMSITVDGKEEYAGEVIIAPQQAYYHVTIAESEHGRIVAPEGVDLTHLLGGSSIVFKAEPEDGYALTKLMAGTEDITNTRTLVVKGDVTVTPTFTPIKTYRVSLQKPDHGKLSVRETEFDLTKVPEDAVLHFICTPDNGYELEEVKAGDQDITQSLYVKVNADMEVSARYKKIPVPTYKVTISVLGYGQVTADCPDMAAVPDGTMVHLTCTPKDDHYYLANLQANGEDIMDSKNFMIDGEDVQVKATFKEHTAIEEPSQTTLYTLTRSGDNLVISGVLSNHPVSLVTLTGETLFRREIAVGESLAIDLKGIPSGAYILFIGNSAYKFNL